MRFLLPYLLFALSSCAASQPTASESYFRLLDKYPAALGPDGDATQGEIEIVRDPVRMQEIEKSSGRKVGIVAQDRYWIWINDPVKFPSGKEGVYGRFLWVKSLSGPAGIAVMPLLADGKIALNRNYRHATRSWEYELPRGGINTGESSEDAARREVKEETGMQISKLHNLGEMAVDTGFTNSIVPIFMAQVVKQDKATPEESEAIASIDAFSLAEIKKGFKQGYLIIINKQDEEEKIPLRDPFLAYAIFQAEIRGLLQ
ncbi:MAG: NUDIX hydrolase [Chlamydiales bacterium]|nr:NUDIX hydrolase [Chlamydiales bacterium]